MHVADWFATYCALAGVDPTDTAGEKAGLLPIDSLNLWPMLSGANLTSPRSELFMNADTAKGGGCLIQGDWKLLTGKISSASWAGPTYPNASSIDNTLDQYTADCGGAEGGRRGCLYNVGQEGSWTEHEDLSAQYPEILDKMVARLSVLSRGFWNPNSTAKSAAYSATCQNAQTVQTQKWSNFYGPFCEL